MPRKFSIKEYLKQRPLSWSAISSFEYDPEQWYDTYILGKRQSSPELTFGSYVDKRLQTDPTYLPTVPRYPEMQYKMTVMFNGIPLVGIPDGLDLEKKILCDYKTGKKAWDKKRTDETGQLTFYLLLLYVTHKLKPEDFTCMIHWLPTQEKGDFTIGLIEPFVLQTFTTKRTMSDLLTFGQRIMKTIKEMESYANQKLSTGAR